MKTFLKLDSLLLGSKQNRWKLVRKTHKNFVKVIILFAVGTLVYPLSKYNFSSN